MRLGKDALVFTKTRDAWCLGFLSQTYLTEIKADTIIVPIVTWEARKFGILFYIDHFACMTTDTVYGISLHVHAHILICES